MKRFMARGLMITALTFGLVTICLAQDTGKWVLTKNTDAKTDITSAVLMLASENGPLQSMEIRVEGRKKKLQVFLNWNKYIDPPSAHEPAVTCRFGDGKPTIETIWTLNETDNGTWRRGSQKQTHNFVKKMMTVDQFIAQITPFREDLFTVTYDVTGLAEAFKPLQEMLDSLRK